MPELMTFSLLNSLNETLAAAIVVVALSMLLYNLTRSFKDRVARTSGAVLACVTLAYVTDVFLSLGPGIRTADAVQRVQWVGIAFLPAAVFHLSDALLATTGLPSRGRRRLAVRALYTLGVAFMLLAAFGNLLVQPIPIDPIGYTRLRAAPLFPLYLIYFVIATAAAFANLNRARLRCQTHGTKRRMAYLQFALLTPIIGIFPFSALLMPGSEFTVGALILVNISNIIVILMLAFLAYPLSFFGSSIPDRVVKADLLRFMLRGPATGLLILGVIIFARQATQPFGLTVEQFVPFGAVAVVLFWQWMVDLALPTLDRRLIYAREDADQLSKIATLNRSLLTHSDLTRLLEAILQALCDYLHVDKAFVVATYNGDPDIIHKMGNGDITPDLIRQESDALRLLFADGGLAPVRWRSYWVLGLYSRRKTDAEGNLMLIGVLALEARDETDPTSVDPDRLVSKLIRRSAQTLDDLLLQTELYAALEGLLPQMTTSQQRAIEVEFKPGRTPLPAPSALPVRDEVVEQVQAALRHYYGGPGMTQSRLLELTVVRRALPMHDQNPVKALRAILDDAIAQQRPLGEQDLKTPEWLLYNILELRFIKGRRVREIANRLYMSEANLYRKQNLAIEAVADTLLTMEQAALDAMPEPSSPINLPDTQLASIAKELP
ncbi:MAG: hypothetical protein H7Y11_04495 [Armatimonadetes bacterium]|nr:hypothetical protein [Anaerolineae bacterium]